MFVLEARKPKTSVEIEEDKKSEKLINDGIGAIRNYIKLYPNDTSIYEQILFKVLDYANQNSSDIAVLILTNTSADPSIHDNKIITLASKYGHTELVKLLLRNYPKVDPSAQNNWAMRNAICSNHFKIVELLLKDPRIDLSINNSLEFVNAVECGNIRIVELLLADKRMDPSARNNESIICAAERGNIHIVELLLKYPGVDPSAQNNKALVYAASHGHNEIVKLLLKYPDVDPSAQNNKALINAASYGHNEIVELLLKYPGVDPSAQNNKALINAASHGYNEIVKLLLKYPDVDPSAQNNKALIYAAERGNIRIVELLLKYPGVDPSVQNNKALINAASNGHIEIVKLLLKYPGVDPSAQNNNAIIYAVEDGHINVVKLLLEYPSVDPSAQNNNAIILTACAERIELFKLLLNDSRVDPGAQNNEALKAAIGMNKQIMGSPDEKTFFTMNDANIEIFELLLADIRIDIDARNTNITSSDPAFIALINKRKELDSHFGLITEDDYYQDKPVELLETVLKQSTKDDDPYLTANRINYIFNCLDEDKFNKVINSDISDKDLSIMLSHVKEIKYDAFAQTRYFDIGTYRYNRRDLLVVFKNLIDIEYVTRKILEYELIPLVAKFNIGHENLLKMYRKYKFDLPLEREYQLADIICRHDMCRLYQYILKGNYLPYVKHDETKVWLELTSTERQFVETFMFPINHHKDYMSALDVKDIGCWNSYIYDGDYFLLNKSLRTLAPLSPEMIGLYNSLNANIIGAPVVNKRCVLYRGIEIEEFDPAVLGASSNLGTSMNTIVWNAFSSCSLVREISDKFQGDCECCLFVIIVPVGAVLLDITIIKNSEFEIVLPPGSIMKYLGMNGARNISGISNGISVTERVGESHVLKYLGYETDEGPFFFESEEERNKTLEEEMNRYVLV